MTDDDPSSYTGSDYDDESVDDSYSTSSSGTGSSDATGTFLASVEERDEVKEIRKASAKETRRVHLWKLAVMLVLSGTAVAITVTTFKSLRTEEQDKFERAFKHFAISIASSAQEQQANIRLAYASMSNIISSAAHVSNATWPFYTFPRFEQLAHNGMYQSKSEVVLMIHLVRDQVRQDWLKYAGEHYQDWVTEGYEIESKRDGPQVYDNFQPTGYPPYITKFTDEGFLPEQDKPEHWVAWTYSPPPATYSFINWDYSGVDEYQQIIQAAMELNDQTLFTRVRNYASAGVAFTAEEHAAKHSEQLASVHDVSELPHAMIFHPVYKDPDDETSEVVAMLMGGMEWDAPLLNLLPPEAVGLVVIIRNNCDQSYSFQINGRDAIYLGEGDRHEEKYEHMEVVFGLSEFTNEKYKEVEGHCIYSMHIYPSSEFEDTWTSNNPQFTALVIAIAFGVVIIVFFVYDMFVQKRNEKLVENAARTNAIVSSLFPSNIRDKVIEQETAPNNNDGNNKSKGHGTLRAFMQDGKQQAPATGSGFSTMPLADLFLETTILFADIVGFTAWSSTREPSHVFTLLETLYSAFDEIAKARRVFKVETVGDCYVAATGMPDPRKDHAVAMCRFARGILKKVHLLTKELEVSLGPDTGDLNLRIGIHSGPVTAGVLRGEKARFQLFGDTMNTTARIESGGMPGRIHLSEETADILIKSGKEHWLEKRENKIEAKGKGLIQTYWLGQGAAKAASSRASDESSSNIGDDSMVETENVDAAKIQRLIEWNVESLQRILKQIVATRHNRGGKAPADNSCTAAYEKFTVESEACFLDEVQEIITLPEFDGSSKEQIHPDEVVLPIEVVDQLKCYVTCIASMYRSNSFHNFEHASHVTMSVLKLLARIVAPAELEEAQEGSAHGHAAIMHDHTYGITSDPLTQFACAFSALIHDADHSGAPNAQLIKENAPVAAVYRNRSVAEQNSLALAWNLLMEDQFQDLRNVIYIDSKELQRFRELVVNMVMATDIVDRELKALRNARWEKAFSKEDERLVSDQSRDAVNRKATIVIEHLIQASDISHTMQHWHIYRKWNERFFRECYMAYRNGRADTDPSNGWYKGEIGFFDFYIIPLAKKLKNCGVFGKSSDEYLNYAQRNRAEWESKGQQVVAEMVESITKELGPVRKRRQSLR